jgi:hypothetical protein
MTRQMEGKILVWFGEMERKISQIINDYIYLPFFLIIIVWYRGILCRIPKPDPRFWTWSHLYFFIKESKKC